jgi:hypothetical protein
VRAPLCKRADASLRAPAAHACSVQHCEATASRGGSHWNDPHAMQIWKPQVQQCVGGGLLHL